MRFALFCVEPRRHVFVWTSHHILMDGWSLPLILHDVFGGADVASGAEICTVCATFAGAAGVGTRARATFGARSWPVCQSGANCRLRAAHQCRRASRFRK
jgi:hypothetical protein